MSSLLKCEWTTCPKVSSSLLIGFLLIGNNSKELWQRCE